MGGISAKAFGLFLIFAIAALSVVFRTSDPWLGMTIAMSGIGFAAMLSGTVRQHFKPSLYRVGTGLAAGIVLYGITLIMVNVFSGIWPGWEGFARALYAGRGSHSVLFLGPTLVLIIFAEELLWRGIVAQFLMGRFGKAAGFSIAAGIYALAHWSTFNPLLLAAAFGCGLFWGLLYAMTDDLTVSTVSHLVWDVLLLFLFPVV